jgi:hypothetical protein
MQGIRVRRENENKPSAGLQPASASNNENHFETSFNFLRFSKTKFKAFYEPKREALVAN